MNRRSFFKRMFCGTVVALVLPLVPKSEIEEKKTYEQLWEEICEDVAPKMKLKSKSSIYEIPISYFKLSNL